MNKKVKGIGALLASGIFLAGMAIPVFAGYSMWNNYTPSQQYWQQHPQPYQQSATYQGTFMQANNSGVSGSTQLTLNGNQLTINIQAFNISPNEPHDMHIHGFSDNHQSVCAPSQADTNGDGLISTAEATPYIGPIMVPFDTVTAGNDRVITYQKTISINPNQLQPLENRVVEIHGLWLNNGYNADLPVACAQLTKTASSSQQNFVPTYYQNNNWSLQYQRQQQQYIQQQMHQRQDQIQQQIHISQQQQQSYQSTSQNNINFSIHASSNGISPDGGKCMQWNGSLCTVVFYPGQ